MSSPPMATPKIRLKLSSSAVTSAAAPLSQTAATSSQLQQPEASSSTVPRRKQSPNGAPHGPSNVPSSSTQPHQLKTRIRLPRGAGMATATGAAYDSDDDEGAHALEEHAILRFPKNDPLADHFRQLVKARKELPVDTELTWKDARRGLFTFQGERLLAELCDLPCIIESQKTLDHKHFIKVADISQIIRLSRVPDAPTTTSSSGSDPVDAFFRADFPPETYVENSGITPPLKHVRLRRFRKRVNKRTVESIEREVARLLREDARALKVDLKQLDAVDNELDTYYANQDRNAAAEEAAVDEQIGEDGLAEPLSDTIMDGVEGEGADGGIAEGTAALNEAEDDLDLEQELSKALADLSSDDEDDEEEEEEDEEQAEDDGEEEDFDEQDEFEDDDEIRPYLEQQRMIREELKDFEEKIAEKAEQRDKSMNALMKKRFEDIIGNLTHEMELKTTQLNDVEAKIEEMRDAGRRAAAGGADDDEEYEEGEVSDYSDDGEEGDEYGDNESERGHDEMEHGGGDEEVELDYGDDEYEPPQAASD